jgi:hypothetical protein
MDQGVEVGAVGTVVTVLLAVVMPVVQRRWSKADAIELARMTGQLPPAEKVVDRRGTERRRRRIGHVITLLSVCYNLWFLVSLVRLPGPPTNWTVLGISGTVATIIFQVLFTVVGDLATRVADLTEANVEVMQAAADISGKHTDALTNLYAAVGKQAEALDLLQKAVDPTGSRAALPPAPPTETAPKPARQTRRKP